MKHQTFSLEFNQALFNENQDYIFSLNIFTHVCNRLCSINEQTKLTVPSTHNQYLACKYVLSYICTSPPRVLCSMSIYAKYYSFVSDKL